MFKYSDIYSVSVYIQYCVHIFANIHKLYFPSLFPWQQLGGVPGTKLQRSALHSGEEGLQQLLWLGCSKQHRWLNSPCPLRLNKIPWKTLTPVSSLYKQHASSKWNKPYRRPILVINWWKRQILLFVLKLSNSNYTIYQIWKRWKVLQTLKSFSCAGMSVVLPSGGEAHHAHLSLLFCYLASEPPPSWDSLIAQIQGCSQGTTVLRVLSYCPDGTHH